MTLPAGSVGTRQLKKGAVTRAKIAPGTLKSLSGKPGRTGAAGANGIDGVPGARGPAGATGGVGATGPQGSTGSAGTTGATGPSGVISAASVCTPIANGQGGSGPCDDTGYAWVHGSPQPVTLTAGQDVQVIGEADLISGSGSSPTFYEATIGVCAEPSGGPSTGMTTVGAADSVENDTPADVTVDTPISLTRVITAASLGGAGTYSVGLCDNPPAAVNAAVGNSEVTTLVLATAPWASPAQGGHTTRPWRTVFSLITRDSTNWCT